jgi:hypothetical protein
VTADKIVAQITMEHPADGGPPVVSFTGSRFEGLRIGGRDASLSLNSSLLEGGGGAREQLTWPLFQKTGRQQAAKLVKSAQSSGDAYQWVVDRYSWIASKGDQKGPGFILCSLVDGVDPAVPGKSFGHVMDIPGFGKVVFGEVMAFPASVHLSMIRAELGSPTSGGVSAADVSGNGNTIPPRMD